MESSAYEMNAESEIPVEPGPPVADRARYRRAMRLLRIALGALLLVNALGQLLFWMLGLDTGRLL
jgi:hypothetical protein